DHGARGRARLEEAVTLRRRRAYSTGMIARALLLAGSAALAACAAPAFVRGKLPQHVPPAPIAGVAHAEGDFTGSDGVRLFQQSWRPAAPKAAVVIMHGLKDHS